MNPTPFQATGGLDQRRAERPLPERAWPEARKLRWLAWLWPDFIVAHRPFDHRID